MYGCPWGIVRSKLALSTRRVAAKVPRTTVAARQASTTARRWLKTRRSSQLPLARSKDCASRAAGIMSMGTALIVGSRGDSAGCGLRHHDPARADQRIAPAVQGGEARERRRLRER